jgi:23S rRNA pseudouridine1911/1915/1917 synthase
VRRVGWRVSGPGEVRLAVSVADAGRSALSVLSEELPDAATWALKQLFAQDLVTLDGRPCGAGQSVAVAQELHAEWDGLPRIVPARLPGFEVLWSGADTLACFKPSGVTTEPERDQTQPLLRAAVLHHLRGAKLPIRRPRIVHRLDKDTSGVILVALSRSALASLSTQLEERRVHKVYQALVAGSPREDAGLVDAPLDTGRGRRVRAGQGGKAARTRWSVLERFRGFAWVQAEPETGRTHQIRVHLAHLGHPVVADGLYGKRDPLLLSRLKAGYRPKDGKERPLLDRVGLHAARITFSDPTSGESVDVEAPLPKDLAVCLKQLRRYARR